MFNLAECSCPSVTHLLGSFNSSNFAACPHVSIHSQGHPVFVYASDAIVNLSHLAITNLQVFVGRYEHVWKEECVIRKKFLSWENIIQIVLQLSSLCLRFLILLDHLFG